eukprot:scaffold65150_cov67-Phaeocystis_antarctica.AAC.8
MPPLVVRSEASALASSSACTVVVRPLKAAPIRAVLPLEVCRLTLAPRCKSICTIAFCPAKETSISSVLPARSAQRASTPPPSFSHAATARASPFSAACCR